MDTLTKKCWRCPPENNTHALENFCRGGKDSVCKKCRYELNAEWAGANKEKLKPKRAEYMRKYRAEHRAKKKD